jgi:hypothetical protein
MLIHVSSYLPIKSITPTYVLNKVHMIIMIPADLLHTLSAFR